MSEGNRRQFTALGLVIIVVLGLAITAWFNKPRLSATAPDNIPQAVQWDCQQQETKDSDQGQPSPEQGVSVVPASENQTGTASEAQRNQQCEDNNRNNADLVAQKVSAESARVALDFSRASYWLGFVNLIALLFTLCAAAWAAYEARNGAKAAVDTLKSNRAWVMLVDVKFRVIKSGANKGNIQISPVWKNCGNTPAITIVSSYDFTRIDPKADLQDMTANVATLQIRGNLGQGESFVRHIDFNKDMRQTAIRGDFKFHLYVIVTYFDIFEPLKQRISEARFTVEYDATQTDENKFYTIPTAIQNRVT